MPDIAVGAKRYDGGSGSAVFTGTVFLKPSQLFDTDLATVALWNGGTEIGCTVSDLWPRHPDGSVKVIRVSTTLTLASGVQQDLTLRIGTTRLVSGPTEPTITAAWLKQPRLIGCTDAAHLCASRVAPGPLIPVDHASLPQTWKTLLTTQLDQAWGTPPEHPSWGNIESRVMADSGANWATYFGSGTAAYNFLSIMYYRYMTRGNLDCLAHAHHAAQYRIPNAPNPDLGVPLAMSMHTWTAAHATYDGQSVLHYGEAYQGHAEGEPIPTNPEGYAASGAAPVADAVWFLSNHDYYMAYVGSGWLSPLWSGLAFALFHHIGNGTPAKPVFPTTMPWVELEAYNNTNADARGKWRGCPTDAVFYWLYSAPMALNFRNQYSSVTLPSPRTDPTTWRSWVKITTFDYAQAGADAFRVGQPNSFMAGIWGFQPGYGACHAQINPGFVVGSTPNFQLILVFNCLLFAYLNVYQDTRFLTEIVNLATFLKDTQLSTPITSPTYGNVFYRMPYCTHPSPGNSGEGYHTQMLLALWTYAWRVTGDTNFLTIADRMATVLAYVGTNGSGFEVGSGVKESGEVWHMAFHAAAWRAGVPATGWELGDTVNPTALTGQTSLTFTPSTPVLNLTTTIALAGDATLEFTGTTPYLGPTIRYAVSRSAIGARTIRDKDMRIQNSGATLTFEGLGLLSLDTSMVGDATFGFSAFGRLQTPTITETFTHANTTSGITADHTWGLLAGTAFKINNNMAVVENSPAWVTQIARLDSTLLSTSDFDVIALIGDWLISGSDAWLGVGGFNDAATTGYGAHVAWNGFGHTVSIWKWVAGAPTKLSADVTVNAPTPGDTQLRVRRIASTGVTTAFYAGVQVAEVTDTSITSALKNLTLWAGMGTVPGTCRLGVDLATADIVT